MIKTVNPDNPTIDIREGETLDVDVIDRVLKQAISGLSGTPRVKQYPSGASNLTYAIDYDGRSLVLRRPPFGKLPKSGHDMNREYTVMNKLKPVFPAVPDTLFYTDDKSLIGAEFYVMEKVEGFLIHKNIPADWGWGKTETRALCTEFIDKLADLHSVDYEAAGLGDFGKPDGYLDRQILGWNKRYEKAYTPDVEAFEDVREWLDSGREKYSKASKSAGAVVHGDYRIDNAILSRTDPTKIIALLDWEISALGDPVLDLGNTLAYWIEATDPDSMKEMIRQPSTAPGMLTRAEFMKYYADKTGADLDNIHYAYVYGVFRLAVILQQIYYRFYHGQTQDARFKTYAQSVNGLGMLARMRIATGTI